MIGNLYLLAVTIVINFLVYWILKKENLILISNTQYILRFIFLPTLCLFIIAAAGFGLSYKINSAGKMANYLPVAQMLLMCFVVAALNSNFTATLCGLCFPVFITVVFNDWKMTRNIVLLSLAFLLLTLWGRQTQAILPAGDSHLLSEYIIVAGAIVAAGIVSKILLEFQEDRERMIRRAYKSRNLMQEQLNRDAKTGLYTAKAFFSILNEQIEGNEGESVVLAVIDIDDFKKVNDTYGHSNGDKVLERLASCLLQNESEEIIPSRFGGEEFAVILKTDPADAYRWMENFRRHFAAEKYEFMPGRVTISCGIATWKKEWTDEQLFKNADHAMYYSKQCGKNLVTIFSSRIMG